MVTYDRSDYDPYLNFINPSARNVHCILQWLSSFKMTWCFNIYHFSIFKFCIHDIALAWFPLYFEYRASEHRYFTLTFTRQHCWKKGRYLKHRCVQKCKLRKRSSNLFIKYCKPGFIPKYVYFTYQNVFLRHVSEILMQNIIYYVKSFSFCWIR